MSCEGYGLLISRWVDGEAKPEDARRAEAHVSSCAPCRKLADEFRRNAGLLESALGPEPFGDRVAGSVFGSIARREALWRWGARLGAAAAVLLWALLVRADRNADQERVARQIAEAMRVVERMQILLEQERNHPAEPRSEVALVPYLVRMDETGKPFEGPELPHVVAVGDGSDPRPSFPEEHPGTVAQDRVDAYADFETGTVAVTWNMARPAAASRNPLGPPPAYFVLRREEGKSDWGEPLNQAALVEPRFEDVTARGLTTYEYRIVALVGGLMHDSDDVARLKTPPDLRIEFMGVGASTDKSSSQFNVHVRVNGKWFKEEFQVRPGESIGGPRGTIDFSTGVFFRGAEPCEVPGTKRRYQLATLETPAGRILLWAGTSARGSRQQLDPDERPR